jgi:hypothetical protein
MQLTWIKRSNQSWHKLLEVDLAAVTGTYGVYVVWHGGFPSRVVRVGHGDVGEGLRACSVDARVMDCQRYGPLFVTWAAVAPAGAAGIRRHLADRLRPLIEDSGDPRVVALAANAPF